jgi:hypothetical protein
MIVEKALEKDPSDRYQSMREMVVDLRRISRQTMDEPSEEMPAKSRRVSLLPSAGIAALLLLAAAHFVPIGTVSLISS